MQLQQAVKKKAFLPN